MTNFEANKYFNKKFVFTKDKHKHNFRLEKQPIIQTR